MIIERLPHRLTVAKYEAMPQGLKGLYSLSVSDREISLVAETALLPEGSFAREDGWRALRVAGELDFSLVGVLAALSAALAEAGIPLFAISTFDTDYLLVKEEHLSAAETALMRKGYSIK